MKIFLDTSVLLAACGSARGASRALFDLAPMGAWVLQTSPYAVVEAIKNLPKLSLDATIAWLDLRPRLEIVDDVVTLNHPVIFAASKDRPILFTALAWADVLLTLDRNDFAELLGGGFYGLHVRLPADFLMEERAAGRLE